MSPEQDRADIGRPVISAASDVALNRFRRARVLVDLVASGRAQAVESSYPPAMKIMLEAPAEVRPLGPGG